MKRLQIFILLFLFTSCFTYRTVYQLINQKDMYYWTGEATDDTYNLFVDHSYERVWFDARLIKNSTDTFYLNGFQKGNNHPTGVRTVLNDSTRQSDLGSIFIWTKAWTADKIAGKARWLESALAIAIDDGWRLKMMHSTWAPKE